MKDLKALVWTMLLTVLDKKRSQLDWFGKDTFPSNVEIESDHTVSASNLGQNSRVDRVPPWWQGVTYNDDELIKEAR